MSSQKLIQSPAAKGRFYYGYIVVVAAFFITVVTYGTHNTFGIFLKPLLTEFGWTRAMTSGAFSMSFIVFSLVGFVAGGLNDRFGPRVVITLCGLFSGLGYLLMSQVSTIWQLYLAYGVMIGPSLTVFIALVSTVARWFVQRRTLMTGIVAAGIGVGTLIAAPLANWLILAYGWRASYMILGGIVLVVITLAAQFLRRDPKQMGQVAYGENGTTEEGLKLGTDGFSFKEAVSTRQFWIFLAASLCFGFCLQAVMAHIALHATDIGASGTSAANILATIGGASIVGKVVLGSIGDRIGNRQVFAIGLVLMSVCLLWLLPAREVWGLYLFVIIFGLAYGGCVAQQSPLVAALFGLTSHGLIFGVITIGFGIGSAMGPFVTGYIFDVTGSYQVAFLVGAAIGVVGFILTILLTPTRAKSLGKGLMFNSL